MRHSLIFFLLYFSNFANGQSGFVRQYEYFIDEEEIFEKHIENLSSLVLEVKEIDEIQLEIDEMRIDLISNPHSPGHSQLIFPHKKENISLKVSSKISQSLKIYILDVPEMVLDNDKRTQMALDSCQIPNGIDQDIWRSGLPPPTVSPSLNSVNHCIVHHSAGSNTATDYVDVVRNIYIYHTDVNGWDDIGYNYLIAQDGTLFHGRDGQGQIEDDNVRGAHFCAKNSGTMGICLLGNYLFTPPDTSALNTLQDLILWKLNKENLQALDSFMHPLPAGNYLDVISGHKDGCATECPGTFLYGELQDLRTSIDSRLGNCLPLNIDKIRYNTNIKIYPNPTRAKINIESDDFKRMNLYNQVGQNIDTFYLKEGQNQIDLRALKPGIYFARFFSNQTSEFRKIQILD